MIYIELKESSVPYVIFERRVHYSWIALAQPLGGTHVQSCTNGNRIESYNLAGLRQDHLGSIRIVFGYVDMGNGIESILGHSRRIHDDLDLFQQIF